MANYDVDPIAKCISDYWSEDTEGEWVKYKTNFAMRPKVERIGELKKVDSWLENETKITKEHAAILTRKRELEDVHWALDRLGK